MAAKETAADLLSLSRGLLLSGFFRWWLLDGLSLDGLLKKLLPKFEALLPTCLEVAGQLSCRRADGTDFWHANTPFYTLCIGGRRQELRGRGWTLATYTVQIFDSAAYARA